MNIDAKRIKANFSAYNRLEARPRTQAFERSLRAEVRDPLWLLTRQWQFGEFEGEDAGSPVKARILYTHTPMHRLSFGENPGKTLPFDGRTMPLETKVERETVALVTDRRAPGDTVTSPHSDLLFGIRLGKDFWSRLGAADTPANRKKLLEKYPFKVFEKDQAAAQVAAAVAGLVPDGCALFRDTTSGVFELWVDSEPTLTNTADLKTAALAFATDHTARFGRMFSQPANAGDSAWLSNRLEFSFQISEEPSAANNQAPLVLAADEYFHDRLDWYAFDLARRRVLPPLETDPTDVAIAPPLELARKTEEFVPKLIEFRGIPTPRFWEMEEGLTDFGKIDHSATGLLHLLLAEFGLIFSNDWFVLPHSMPIHSVCEIDGLVVTDVFGQHTVIRPANRGASQDWQRWAMFRQSDKTAAWSEHSSLFYLAPTVGQVLESDPIERVHFLRDELSNMVWAVENVIPSQLGNGLTGKEAAMRSADDVVPYTPEFPETKIKYTLGTTVPANWIPFVPVRINGSLTEIQLQRARMIGAPGPQSRLLTEKAKQFFINEEEVPRTGVIVERSYQRVRWLGGKTFVWIGRRKQAGRGEGWSGLMFDQVENI